MKKLLLVTFFSCKTLLGFTQQNQLENLISLMSKKTIVALGEGTHGTKEFNEVRIRIIKRLIIQYGFRTICWENAFGNTYRLNQMIASKVDLRNGLKAHMTAIWQTKEVLNFLVWLQAFNQRTDKKVQLIGLDWNYLEESAKIVNQYLPSSYESRTLLLCAKNQDSAWEAQNDTTKQLDISKVIQNATRGYLLTKILLKKRYSISKYPSLNNALENLANGFYVLYQAGKKAEAKTRDKMMAETLIKIHQQTSSSKMIIWAHNGHIAFKATTQNEKDANPGGMGLYLRQYFKSNYFAVGTSTANGYYSATNDQVDTHSNVFQSYKLSSLKNDTWESLFYANKLSVIVTSSLPDSLKQKRLSLRMIGFRPEDKNAFTEKTKLQDYFDALIFIRNTTSSQHI